MTTLETNVAALHQFLDDAEDAGHTTVATRDVRRTLAGQPLDGDQPTNYAFQLPKFADVVLDNYGAVWRYNGAGYWVTPGVDGVMPTEDLMSNFGPLTLIARDGKRWEG